MRSTLQRLLVRLGPFLGLVAVIVLFSLPAETRPYFLTFHNFKIILTQTVIVAIGALGMTMIIVSGGIDLSVGSGIAFTSVIGALLIQHGSSVAMVVLATIAAGGAIGLVNGAAIAGLRVTPFIITLGTLGVARGAAKWLADNQTVNYEASPINGWMMTAHPFGYSLPAGVWVAIVLAVATAVLLRRTVFGRHVFALGSNEATARLCGVPTTRLKILIYAAAGCFFGVAGLFQLSRLRQGDPTVADRAGTGHHRGRDHRRGELEWRRGRSARLHDRRLDHVRPAQRFAADGLADLFPGDHHRACHHRGRFPGSPAARPIRLNGPAGLFRF